MSSSKGLLSLILSVIMCSPTQVAFSSEETHSVSPFGWALGGHWAPKADWKCSPNPGLSPEAMLCESSPSPLRGASGYSVELRSDKLFRAVALFRFSQDRYGDKAKSRMRSLQDILTNKYGVPQELDFLKQGATYDEPQYWTMSLWRNERVRGAGWKTPQATIVITVTANSPSDTILGLLYEHPVLRREALEKATQQESEAL